MKFLILQLYFVFSYFYEAACLFFCSLQRQDISEACFLKKKIRRKKFIAVFFLSVLPFFSFVSCTHIKNKNPDISISSAAADCPDPFSYIEAGWRFFQKKNLIAARACFENINYGDSRFVPALLEIQKINYIEADWSRFFGLTFYYRKKLLATKRMTADNFRQKMPALEILALLRHCRFEEAFHIMEWSLKTAQRAGKDASQIQKAADFFKLKEKVGDSKSKAVWMDWQNRVHLWPVNFNQLKGLDNPKRLRAQVKSKC